MMVFSSEKLQYGKLKRVNDLITTNWTKHNLALWNKEIQEMILDCTRLDYSDSFDSERLILLDFCKAFDSVEYKLILKAL